jgi:hypothetical protein
MSSIILLTFLMHHFISLIKANNDYFLLVRSALLLIFDYSYRSVSLKTLQFSGLFAGIIHSHSALSTSGIR